MAWQYQTVSSSNGQVNTNGGTISINQMLNEAGSANWELAAVVPLQPGAFEFVLKRPVAG